MERNLHLVCPHCGAKNRAPQQRLGESPSCGRCKGGLFEAKPVDLDGERFDKQLAGSDLPLLVDFWAPWCGPCKNMAPAFREAALMLFPRVRLAKVNTEEQRELAARFGINSIPTMVLFRQGREAGRVSGAMPAAAIAQWVRERV